MPLEKQINIKLSDTMHAQLEAAAKKAGTTTGAYGRLLFQAAYSARYRETGDLDLDATVAATLILFGADLDTAQVARALKCSEATVARILQAWREHGPSQRRAA